MKIEMIALDLDGTALTSERNLTDFTRETLEKAAKAGIHVVVATGRALTAVPGAVKNLNGLRYLITSNGSKIIDLKDGSCIYSDCIPEETVCRISDILKGKEIMTEVCVDGIAYTDELYYRMAVEGRLPFRNQQYVIDTRTPVRDVLSFMVQNKRNVENINLNFQDLSFRSDMMKVLEQIDGCTKTSSFQHNIELGGESTSKASALKFLCGMLKIGSEKVMTFGDSLNDLTMLRFSGYPVAVANAEEQLKEYAFYVTGSNDDDGVAAAIEKFAFEKI